MNNQLDISKFKFDIKDNIVIVSSFNGIKSLEIIKELKEMFENTYNKIYNYWIYSDSLGYYHGYDFLNNCSVYCTSLSKPTAIKWFKEEILIHNQDET